MGIAAADIVLEFLTPGRSVALGPRPTSGGSYRVDWTQLQRWKLPESALPEGTVLLNRPPFFWVEHRTLALAIAGGFALQSAVLAFLLLQMHRRQRAEASLQVSEERMAFAAASVDIGLWQHDLLKGSSWATGHCREMIGLRWAEAFNPERFLQAVHADDRRATAAWMRAVTRSATPLNVEFRIARPDGSVRHFLARGQARFVGTGRASSVSGIFSDITACKLAESDAQSQRQVLAHITRVSALGELSGAIAHEINQPLTAILANAQAARRMIDHAPPDLDDISEALDDIIEEDIRAGEVIRRLRGMLRRGEPSTELLDLNDLAEATLQLLQPELIARKMDIRLDMSQRLPAISGDAVQLQQVLINLVMNAMDALSGHDIPRREIVVGTQVVRTGEIRTFVADNGPGLPAEHQARIFEPFFTTKDHGLGLGLAICASIARAHGGKLELRNGENGGTHASLFLPAVAIARAAE